jgi:hypothetical protein
MYMQLLKIINGPKPKSAIALIIQDDGGLENPGQLMLTNFLLLSFNQSGSFMLAFH